MSERVEEYKRLCGNLRKQGIDNPGREAIYTRLCQLWCAMTRPEQDQIDVWLEDEQLDR